MDPFGATPLPTVLDLNTDCATNTIPRVNIDIDALIGSETTPDNGVRQQPQTQQVAVYDATPNTVLSGNLLDVNPHFYVYRVKNGLIRVLHRSSTSRLLLRGHQGQQVTDIRFFLDGDVLGTVGSSLKGTEATPTKDNQDPPPPSSSIIIWRIFEQKPELNSEKLLEIATPHLYITNLIWHPFNPNQFFMIHSSVGQGNDEDDVAVATLVESTRIQTSPHPTESHALCQFHSDTVLMDGAVQLRAPSRSSISAMEWSGRDARHVLTVHDDATILLWDLNQPANHDISGAPDGVTIPRILHTIETGDGEPLSHCAFLPHESTIHQQQDAEEITTLTTCFVTASKENSTITVWGSFAMNEKTSEVIPPSRLQIIQMQTENPTSYLLSVGFGPASVPPPSCFLLAADRLSGRIVACHVKSEWSTTGQRKALAIGCDYVVPFVSKHAMYGWCIRCGAASEETMGDEANAAFDMHLFSYQSKAIQALTLTHSMCLPPSRTWKDGGDGIDKIVQVDSEVVEESVQATMTASSSDNAIAAEAVEYEDYELDDDDYGVNDEEIHAPDPSALPTFDDDLGFGAEHSTASAEPSPLPAVGSDNAFANWLGAMAGGTSDPVPEPAPPPGLAPTTAPPLGLSASAPAFLSPMDFLKPAPAAVEESDTPVAAPVIIEEPLVAAPAQSSAAKEASTPTPPSSNKKNRGRSKSPKQQKSKGGRSKSPKSKQKNKNNGSNNKIPKSPFPTGPISILKREEKEPTKPSAVASSSSSKSNSPLPNADMAGLELLFKKVLLSHHEAMVKNGSKKEEAAANASAVQTAVRKEIKSSIVPSVSKIVVDSISASIIKPLQQSVDNLSQSRAEISADDLGPALDEIIQEQLDASMAKATRNVIIPALESTASQVVKQVIEHLPQPPETPSATDEKVDALGKQVSSLADVIGQLATQVKSLEATIAQQQATIVQQQKMLEQNSTRGGPPGLSQNGGPSGPELVRREILVLLDQQNYEAAFTKALSTSTTEMVVFCCSNSDVKRVLGGHQPALSQPILLCLMQQLGAVVSTSTPTDLVTTELDWLQELALVLQPQEPSIQRHAGTVLQQLTTSIDNKMRQGNINLRRPLQILAQILRGLQQPQRYN